MNIKAFCEIEKLHLESDSIFSLERPVHSDIVLISMSLLSIFFAISYFSLVEPCS